ncbi:hypothetical protein [Cerasicoccus maritimus]|uniref:hypothetical protein n=1 Tax=Cerasicoccus maritimus TaxID=490089 RepID=UPI0028529107|nr:hypothetical protein [Cerasicoccus maritimus]
MKIFLIAWVLALAAIALPAMTLEQAQASLNQSQGLVLKGRRPLSGKVMGIVDDQLVFRAARAGGTLDYRYDIEEVERIQFPGNDVAYAAQQAMRNSEDAEALMLMKAMFAQRGSYLKYLTPGEHAFFYQYAELEFEQGDPYVAVAAGIALQDAVTDPVLLRKVDDLVLLGHYQLPLKENARELAEKWVAETQGYGPSALGYYVLGQLDFDAEEYDAALWRALRPVTFSSQFPMDYLNYCYALAIASCIELELPEEEQKLRAEMTDRGFSWPKIEVLAAYETSAPTTLKNEPDTP